MQSINLLERKRLRRCAGRMHCASHRGNCPPRAALLSKTQRMVAEQAQSANQFALTPGDHSVTVTQRCERMPPVPPRETIPKSAPACRTRSPDGALKGRPLLPGEAEMPSSEPKLRELFSRAAEC